MRILSGIQPSGKPHLGNYFSMMKRMIAYQEKGELLCFIADYHSLTTIKSKKEREDNTLEIAADFLALGLDPDTSIFWLQSDVPEVIELSWILSQHVTVAQLELAHSYKDKVSQGLTANGGLFFYPILMAADILAFASTHVPVGKDQKQHIEICRDIAQRFNQCYGETFVIPEPDIIADVATVPGIDGRKMSKSYNNAIYPFATQKQLKKTIMSIVTDSKGVDEAKDIHNSILYEIYSLFLDDKGKQDLAQRFATPGIGYGHIKQDLLQAVLEYFEPYRKERDLLLKDPKKLKNILKAGADRARIIAKPIMEKVRKNVGLYS